MKYNSITPELFIRNRKKLEKKLEKNSIAFVVASDEMPRNGDQNYFYRPNSDLFYLTGITQEKTILVICPDHPDKASNEILFILHASKETEIWQGHKLSKDEASAISGIKKVKWLDEFDSTMAELFILSENIYINTNEITKFSVEFNYSDFRFIENVKKRYPLHNYKRLAPIITSLRLIKEPEEIDLIKKACELTNKAFHRVLKFIKPGVKEFEIEAEITHEFLRNAAIGNAYHPIIGSGKNACFLHYPYNSEECKDGDMILMDFGAEYAYYCADTTRTIPVNGTFSKRQKEVYQAVLNGLKELRKLMVKGITIAQLNVEAGKIMEKEILNLGLITQKDIDTQPANNPAYKKYFMHGMSHFMGLDVHDVGTTNIPFEPGMVLTCEPGIYIPEEGLGIRLENDILITDGEPIDLLEFEPIEIDEIEKLMH